MFYLLCFKNIYFILFTCHTQADNQGKVSHAASELPYGPPVVPAYSWKL
jgi:hypothetical protein